MAGMCPQDKCAVEHWKLSETESDKEGLSIEPPGECGLANILISDLYPPELLENKFFLF